MSLLLLFGGGGGGAPPPVTSLARLHEDLGQVLVRRLGDAGGPRMDRVSAEFDSIIEYVNELADSIDAISTSAIFCIHRDTSAVGNVGGGLDTLHSFSLDTPHRLTTNGDYVRVRYGGTYANTEDDKQLRVSFDGQLAVSFGAVIDLENGEWYVDLTYTRVSATSVRVTGFDNHVQFRMADGAIVASPSGSFHAVRNATLTVSNLDSNAVTLLVQGEGTNDNDVVQNFSIIELQQQ